jgi:hypothetical protein
MAKTKLQNRLSKANSVSQAPKIAPRKSEPNKDGIKLPLSWKKLASKVGVFKRESIRIRLGKIDKYKIALLRMKNISRRKRALKISAQTSNSNLENSNTPSFNLDRLNDLCLIF